MTSLAQVHQTDPKEQLLNIIGDVSHVKLLGNKVLVGIYRRPEKTAGGIYRPDSNLKEDIYQGKVGLVLAVGPIAFVSDDKVDFQTRGNAKVGDWVIYKTTETWPLALNDTEKGHCRMIDDVDIRAVIQHPDLVW